ncbi:MAG TPA: FtsX-like permease family protein, partial [Candidatus Limnocylindria bacterium]|nr:FtsX-like permease family protein [Candidatus Limnocylindria bacterium]
QLPLGAYVTFDGHLALAAFLGAIALGVLLAIPVAWLNLRSHLANALQHESRGATGNRTAQGLRHGFIVAQIALALVLLTGAEMLRISLKRLLETSPGFQADQVFTGQILLPFSKYPDERVRLAFMERLVEVVRSQPGMVTVGLGTLLPFGGNDDNGVTSVDDGKEAGAKALHTAYRNGIVGDYCRVMGIPLVEGRLLENADNDRKLRVCLVDQAFARRHWPGRSALGHRLLDGVDFKPDEAFTVVGVVGTVKQSELADTEPHGTVYYPYKYWPQSAFSLVVRTSMASGSLVPLLRKTVLQLDPQLPIDQLKPMQTRLDESLVTRRSPAVIAGIFATIALLLTAVGTYGVLAYAVSQRQREIGVRMALGALPVQISWQFLSLGLRLLAAGTVLGVIGTWVTGRAMQGLLFNVPALHPATLAGTVSVMAVISLAACWLPARRAAKVHPMEALRAE